MVFLISVDIPNESTQTVPLFWQPVGTTTMVSFLDTRASIASNCPGLNFRCPNTFLKISRLVILFEKLWFAAPSIGILSGVVGNVPLSKVSQRLLVTTVMASLEQLISLPNDTLYSVYISSC